MKLRLLKEKDLENLRRWRMSSEVTKYLFEDPVITEEGQRLWYKKMKKRGDVYWIINFENVDIGYASLKVDVRNKKADPGMYIGEAEYHGRGLGRLIMRMIEKYAFEVLNLHKLYGLILSENYSALISYLKNGWKVEGILVDCVFKHDKFYDVYMMALFKRDWMK